jgi:hypothetical protein
MNFNMPLLPQTGYRILTSSTKISSHSKMWERGGHKERVNDSGYGGYTKTEE